MFNVHQYTIMNHMQSDCRNLKGTRYDYSTFCRVAVLNVELNIKH